MSSGEGRNLRPTLTDHVSARIGSDEGLTHSQSPFRLSAESTSLELDVHTKSENPKKVVLLIIYSPLRYCQEEDTNAGRSGDLTHGMASIGIGAPLHRISCAIFIRNIFCFASRVEDGSSPTLITDPHRRDPATGRTAHSWWHS